MEARHRVRRSWRHDLVVISTADMHQIEDCIGTVRRVRFPPTYDEDGFPPITWRSNAASDRQPPSSAEDGQSTIMQRRDVLAESPLDCPKVR